MFLMVTCHLGSRRSPEDFRFLLEQLNDGSAINGISEKEQFNLELLTLNAWEDFKWAIGCIGLELRRN